MPPESMPQGSSARSTRRIPSATSLSSHQVLDRGSVLEHACAAKEASGVNTGPWEMTNFVEMLEAFEAYEVA